MSGGREADRAHLDALMYRMLGGLLLLGAAVLFGLAVLLLRLPRIELGSGAAMVLPGTAGRHTMAAGALPVLFGGALLLGLPGLAALALGRRPVRFGPRRAARPRSFRRPVLVLLAGLVVLAAVLLRR